MEKKVFLLTPPFTQMNTPYPATPYLKGFLNTLGRDSYQADLGIDVILDIFSEMGLKDLFEEVEINGVEMTPEIESMIFQKERYIDTITSVINFLQNGDPTLAHRICQRKYLPEGQRFFVLEETGHHAFGSMGIQDKARFFATLYLEDINDFIVATIDPYFGFSRYAEKLAMSANSFDELYSSLKLLHTFTDDLLIERLFDYIDFYTPDLVAISIPFPGNLYSGLKCAQILKLHYPDIKIVMGGGYPNTELRSLKDPRVFEFVDYITLDDGEAPLLCILEHLEGTREQSALKRTFVLKDQKVQYIDNSGMKDIPQHKVGTPDYAGLPLERYLSVIETANPMNRLWNDGRWNKLTMAHGCYWGKCTFCDVTLDYIKNYEANSAVLLVDRVEALIKQTGQTGFHFVDEAAPPSVMQAFAIEILKRNVTISWWTNIRFEKTFTEDLCELLAQSGCIAVSGGLEVASDRLLKLIDKGVTIEQMAKVSHNFQRQGILVHAYLMFGFPTQTDQETIDSLEVVRQLFENHVINSGFWHQFSMTEHSPVGIAPEVFNVKLDMEGKGDFANNDLIHKDPLGADHAAYSFGLKKALYNYMHDNCLDNPLEDWFEFDIPHTTIDPQRIAEALNRDEDYALKLNKKIVFTGVIPRLLMFDNDLWGIQLLSAGEAVEFLGERKVLSFLIESLYKLSVKSDKTYTLKEFKADYELAGLDSYEKFEEFWQSDIIYELRYNGLLVL